LASVKIYRKDFFSIATNQEIRYDVSGDLKERSLSGIKEVMPMNDSSSNIMGLLVEDSRLRAGAVL
jgi:hypothetical protein